MSLAPGISILFDLPDESPFNRIELSNGIVPAPPDYLQGGKVPGMPWRRPTEHEMDMLLHIDRSAPATEQYRKIIAISTIPEEMSDIFREFNFKSAADNLQARDIILNKKDRMPEFDKILNHYLDAFDTERSRQMLGIYVLPPNQVSVARDIKKTNKLLGLHFDNATGLDVNNFTDKTNRISFNLGESDRFLWFVNKSIEDIYNQALAEGYVPENEKDLCRYFLETNPDYPVIRLRIKPNEIYIAPTDYVLHDGSTADSSYHDVTFVVLGYFNPLALEKRYSSALESR